MIHWQYKVLVPKDDVAELEKDLNRLAEEGWELGWTINKASGKYGPAPAPNDPPRSPGPPTYTGSFDTRVYLILKRPTR